MPIVPGPIDNRAYVTTGGYHTERIARQTSHESTLRRIQAVRAQALEHMRLAQQLAAQRRELMQSLLDDGLSRADIARELGVSRQAIQKMLAV
jgi:hypothetical protein